MQTVNVEKFMKDYQAKQDDLKRVKAEADSYVSGIPNLSESTKEKITETLVEEFGGNIKKDLSVFENYIVDIDDATADETDSAVSSLFLNEEIKINT